MIKVEVEQSEIVEFLDELIRSSAPSDPVIIKGQLVNYFEQLDVHGFEQLDSEEANEDAIPPKVEFRSTIVGRDGRIELSVVVSGHESFLVKVMGPEDWCQRFRDDNGLP